MEIYNFLVNVGDQESTCGPGSAAQQNNNNPRTNKTKPTTTTGQGGHNQRKRGGAASKQQGEDKARTNRHSTQKQHEKHENKARGQT